MKRNIHYILITLVALFFLNSCSTTSRLAEGEVLYTGVKKVQYNQLDSVPIESGVKDNIFSAINVLASLFSKGLNDGFVFFFFFL